MTAPDPISSQPDEATDDPDDTLARELQRLRGYFSLNSEGIWCIELEPPVSLTLERDAAIEAWLERGRLVECNDTFARMYGYDHASELIGTPLRTFLDLRDERNAAYLRAFFESGLNLQAGESYELDREGRQRVFVNALIGVTDGGCLVRVWGTQRDVTSHRMIETRRLQAQRVQAVEELAAGIAHHFNNMLTVISGNLGLLLDAPMLSPADREALESAARAADHAAGLTRQLLSFSRRHHPNFEPVDLQAVVSRAGPLLRTTLGPDLPLELDLEPVPQVLGEPGLIRRMLEIVVRDARASLEGEGRIRVELRAQRPAPGQELARLRISHRRVRPGPGEPRRSLDPFFAGPPDATTEDLGLSEVHGIVRNLGGALHAIREGGETAVTIELPAAGTPAPTPAPARERLPSERLATLLVVEDDADVLATVRRFLVSAGHRVLTARSADGAQGILERLDGGVDVLIADVHMPDKSGFELAREVRRTRPETAVLLMSGRGSPPELPADLRDVEILAKPFTRRTLERHLRALLPHRQS